ncbi:MAG: hypothetical protein Q9176_004623 [Flavoplaca citrina]
MSSPRRPSPRAAIREWLSHTNAADPTSLRQIADEPSRKHEGHPKKPYSSGQLKERRLEARGAQPRPFEDYHSRPKAKDARDGRNVAEQLGLHAPFRSFASRIADPGAETQPENQLRKRKRKSSSPASLLEPAVYPNVCKEPDQDHKDAEPGKSQDQDQLNYIELSSGASSAILNSPEKPVKTYERRSRHKTREDRYELQKDRKISKTKDINSKARDRPKKKRKGVQKCGAALMQNFSAGNIEADRITLKATAPVGLFGKGRASSPIRRKGLPDLAFSEVKFLSHGRGYQGDSVGTKATSQRRKEVKAADAEAEFSRFFASSKDIGRAANGTTGPGLKKGQTRSIGVIEEQNRSSLPPVDLPEKPFLGFGSCGPGHVSPVVLPRATTPHHFDRLSPSRRSLSARSTAYFTWSRSSPSRYTVSELQRQSRQSLDMNRPESYERPSIEARSRERTSPSRSDYRRDFEFGRSPTRGHDRPCTATKQKGSTDGHASVFENVHDQVSTGIDRGKIKPPELPEQLEKTHRTYAREDPQPSTACKTGIDLTSLLASHNRSELLGVVLDLLLGKASAQTADCRQGAERLEIARSRGDDHPPAPAIAPKSQTPHEAQVVHGPELAYAGSNLSNHPELPAIARRLPDMQRSHSSSTNESKVAAPATRCDSQNPKATAENEKAPETFHPLQHDQPLDRLSHRIESRPNTSNAWTGYRNLYQDQIDMSSRTVSQGSLHKHSHQGSHERHIQADIQAIPTLEESRPKWVDRHQAYVFEEDPLHEPDLDYKYPSKHGIGAPKFSLPQTLGAGDELDLNGQHTIYGVENETHREYKPGSPFEQIDQDLPAGYRQEEPGFSHGSDPSAFAGVRESWSSGQEEHFPSLGSYPWTDTQDRILGSLMHGYTGSVSEGNGPSTGFWKPNRLY